MIRGIKMEKNVVVKFIALFVISFMFILPIFACHLVQSFSDPVIMLIVIYIVAYVCGVLSALLSTYKWG